MSDIDDLLALLARFGIEPNRWAIGDEEQVSLRASEGGVKGYDRFECRFIFSPDGAFKEVIVWE